MSVVKEKEETKIIWSKKEKDTLKEIYGTEILVENGSKKEITSTDMPTDASIVTYEIDGKVYQDLTRGARVKLFDMYYDKFKTGLKIIDFGRGTVKPSLWKYNSPSQKKKRK